MIFQETFPSIRRSGGKKSFIISIFLMELMFQTVCGKTMKTRLSAKKRDAHDPRIM